jgi:hypothetical protein
MIYNTKYTTPETIQQHINKIHPNLQFTPLCENNLCFLDLLLIRQPDKIEIDIYCKPTTTDTTINYTSNHPNEHKVAACRYLTNRMPSLPLTTDRKESEWQKILAIAENNKFPAHLITRLKRHTQHKTHTDKTNNKNNKWATFTYQSHKARKITNLFKQTDIKTAFRSTNTIQQQTRPKNRETTPDHNKSGIYKLLWNTCNKVYIGQTSRSLSLRFSEHIRYIKNNDPQSAYAQHILQNIHEYGTLTDNMSLLKPIHNTAKLIPYEQLFIQTFHHNGSLTNEQSSSALNPLFQLTFDTHLKPHTTQQPINTYHQPVSPI